MSIYADMKHMVDGDDRQTNFGTMLLKLIFKADIENRARLAVSYPNAVKTVERYKETGEILNLEDD